MTQQSRAPAAALREDPGSIPNTRPALHNCLELQLQGSNTLTQTYMQTVHVGKKSLYGLEIQKMKTGTKIY